jgi:hypothetical protein
VIIQADKLPRLFVCEGSAEMEGATAPSEHATQSESAREGTAAHELASAVLLNLIPDAKTWLGKTLANGVIVTSDMADYVSRYVDVVGYRVVSSAHVEVNTDWGVNFATGLQINGRADWIDFDGTTLHVDDQKYGYRLVEPEMNWTLISHAIGFCKTYGVTPARIVFTIHQHRARHYLGPVREWIISGDQLAEFEADIIDKLTTRGSTLVTSEHCRDCAAYAICPAAREAEMNSIEASKSQAFTDEISNDALAVHLRDINRAIEVLGVAGRAYSELASHRIQNGQNVPDHALEMGQGNRVFKGVTAARLSALTMGAVPVSALIEPEKLVTPAAAERAGVPAEIVAQYASRPSTGLKLVQRDVNKLAAKLFGGKPAKKG